MKRIITTLVLFALFFGLTGCGGLLAGKTEQSGSSISGSGVFESGQSRELTEGRLMLCVVYYEHPMTQTAMLGFIERARELGYDDIVISMMSTAGFEEGLAQWRADIQKYSPEGVALWIYDDSYYDFIKPIADEGVVFVLPYAKHEYAMYYDVACANPCATPNEELCEMAAEYLVKELRERNITSGSIAMTRQSTSGVYLGYYDVFNETLARIAPEYIMIDPVYVGWDIERDKEKVMQLIEGNTDIVAAFGGTANCGMLWDRAMNLTGREDIIALCLGYGLSDMSLLEGGGIDAFMAAPIYDCAALAAEMLDGALREKTYKYEQWQPVLPAHIITRQGEGRNSAEYYTDIYNRAVAFDWDSYLA